MRVLVLGAGGIGGYFGGRLAQTGTDVTFLVRPRRLAQLRQDGLRIESPRGAAVVAVPALVAAEVRPDYDLVVLTCKAYDLDGAIASIRPALKPGGAVLPLLNGLAHMERLSAAFGAHAVLGGVAQAGLTLTDDGVVRHFSPGAEFVFGEVSGAITPRVEAFATACARAEAFFTTRLVADITREMWQKLVGLGTNASACCLMRSDIGSIAATPDGTALLHRMFDAACEAARREGYPPADAFVTQRRAALADPGSRADASMLRDLQAGRRTEADHITGYLLAALRKWKLDDTLYAAAYTHLRAHEVRLDAAAAISRPA